MAKGQQRSNREAKKPKAKKPLASASAPQQSFMTRGLAPAPGGNKKKR